jgi:hypothetical protein
MKNRDSLRSVKMSVQSAGYAISNKSNTVIERKQDDDEMQSMANSFQKIALHDRSMDGSSSVKS